MKPTKPIPPPLPLLSDSLGKVGCICSVCGGTFRNYEDICIHLKEAEIKKEDYFECPTFFVGHIVGAAIIGALVGMALTFMVIGMCSGH
ncbi:MAG: hypothetical protein KGL39_55570 [Patescibacteria group bacterium]|nr:hypothetical protein [Patescibacteria group bacterium]